MKIDQASNNHKLVIFRVQDEEFGLDIHDVLEVLSPMSISHLPNAPAHIKGVINLRGRVIPVIDLCQRLAMSATDDSIQHKRTIIVEVKETVVGLLVDDVSELLQLPDNKRESVPELLSSKLDRGYLKGVGKLDDRLILILDLSELISIPEPHLLDTTQDGETNG